jgi:hypothetical protein
MPVRFLFQDRQPQLERLPKADAADLPYHRHGDEHVSVQKRQGRALSQDGHAPRVAFYGMAEGLKLLAALVVAAAAAIGALQTLGVIHVGRAVEKAVGSDNGSNGSSGGGSNSSATETGGAELKVETVTLQADQPEFSGSCPHAVTFAGHVAVAGAGGSVKVRFDRSDGSTSDEKTLEFTDPGDQAVTDTITVESSTSGSNTLHVLEPEDRSSGPVSFDVSC